ncbi:hypothetical protein PENANT_c002G04910 [Penicillium antarcticum]|uniref:FAD-binding domain-containing protein n=1 Tax=Penicillium antarcticum TaxID=416450 RepID=A0A1V6QMA6_9EURO|nr:hypothetical protein PENANT_c002G04910 [Penicillium antarcticum]
MANQTPRHFTVVIVGSGIAGISLARALAHEGIHSIVLEKRSQAAAIGGGASIGIFPNGAKWLDELGLFDEILRSSDPILKSYLWSDGALLSRRNYPRTVFCRLGYPILFIQRHMLLGTLHHGLPKRFIQVVYENEVISIEQMTEIVSITCDDGSVLFGSLVVGADGMGSIVQGKIKEHDQSENCKLFNPPVEFSCIYGVSKFTENFTKDTLHQSYNWGYSVTAVNNRDETYWCVYLKDNTSTVSSNVKTHEPLETLLQPILFKDFACGTNLSELPATATARCHFPLKD